MICSAGIDIGIDRANNNALKFIEINVPSVTRPELMVKWAEARVNYYSFLFDNYEKYRDNRSH
jgi:hypothetical protein